MYVYECAYCTSYWLIRRFLPVGGSVSLSVGLLVGGSVSLSVGLRVGWFCDKVSWSLRW